MARSRRTAAVVAALAALLLQAGCGKATLDSKAVHTEAETVESLGAEGSLLADQAVKGRLKESFLQVQAADLAEQAAKTEEGLEPSLATARLRATVEQLQQLAEDVSVVLREVETDPRNDEGLRRAAARLEELSSAAEKIAGRT